MPIKDHSRIFALLTVAGISLAAPSAHAQEGLVIGSVLPLTGAYGAYGAGMSAGINIAVDEVNENGGVLGQPVKIIIEDDQGDPSAGLNAARKLIDVDGADILVGTFASGITLPILAYTVPAGIPVMTVSGAPAISDIGKDSGLAFRMVTTEGYFAEGYAVHAAEQGFKRAYILAANNAAQLDAADSFETRFPEAGGEVVGRTIFEPSQASYQSEVNTALDADPDIIMLAAYTPDAITIARMLYQLDPDVALVGPLYALNDSFIAGVGAEVAEGVLAVDAMSAEGTPGFEAFLSRYVEATGQQPTSNPYAVMDYDMVIVAALAAEAAKSTNPADFVPFIREVANAPGQKVTSFAEGVELLRQGTAIDYDGASSPVEFIETGDQASMFLRGFKLENGAISIVGPVTP